MMKNKIFLVAILLVATGAIFIYNGPFLSATLSQPAKEAQITLPQDQEKSDGNESITKEENDEANRKEKEVLGLEKINEMKKEDLMEIDGIGEITAKKILETGKIKNREDLMEINGIGEVTTEKIEEYVSNWDRNSQNDESDKNSEEEQNEFKGETESAVTLTEKELEVIFRAMKKSKTNSEEKELKNKKNVLASESKKESQPEEIDLNKANLKQLQKINGIGPAYANRIIKARPFCSIEELVKVSGVGDATVKNIKDQGLAVASCNKSDQSVNDNNEYKNTTNKQLESGLKQKDQKIEEIKEEVERLKEENEELNEENEELEEEINGLENSLERSRDRLGDERSNDRDLKEKLEVTRVQRDACKFKNQININEASKEDLMNVSGVGDSISKDILNFTVDSPITYFEQLKEINGVGPVIVDNFIDSNFCAEDPIVDDNNDDENGNANDGSDDNNGSNGDDSDDNGDSGNGSSEINEYNVSFEETNGLEGVEIELYEDENQNNLVETIITDSNGEIDQELEEGNYWLISSHSNYEDYTDNFSLSEDEEIRFELTPTPQPQNLLENPSFEEDDNWNTETTKTDISSEKSKSSNKSIKMEDITTSYNGRETISDSVNVEGDKEYKFGAHYYLTKTENDPEKYQYFLQIVWIDGSGNKIDDHPGQGSKFSAFSGWNKVELTTTSPQNAKKAKIKIRVKRNDADYEKPTVFWDDVFLTLNS